MLETFDPGEKRNLQWRAGVTPLAQISFGADAAGERGIADDQENACSDDTRFVGEADSGFPFEPGSFDEDLWVHSECIARKRLLRRAVDRNRAKRRLRDAARHVLPSYACRYHQYLIVARVQAISRGMADIRWDLVGALRQAGCLLHEPGRVAMHPPELLASTTGLEDRGAEGKRYSGPERYSRMLERSRNQQKDSNNEFVSAKEW
jgi:hypothetical protein